MKFGVLVSAFLLPVVAFAYGPSPLLADDGRDLSFLLKRYDGPSPILQRAVKGKRHIVPRTLQVEEVPVRKALNGLVERQQCRDAGYVPCPGGTQCCPAGTVCGPGTCCPAGSLACARECCSDVLSSCCPGNGCCPSGQVCFTAINGLIGCCPRGQVCTTITGCLNPTTVACPGETFCCSIGYTCSRDAARNAICLDANGRTPSGIAIDASPTLGVSNDNSNNNSNNNSNHNDIIIINAALPQVTTASSLMAIVSFLSAFLL